MHACMYVYTSVSMYILLLLLLVPGNRVQAKRDVLAYASAAPTHTLGPAPHDPRVHKPTIRETRMTRVVNGVRHTTLSDDLFRQICQ